MAPVKRWFPVSHDINADPEVWEMRNTFGEWTLSVWLQMLSIADRNEGEITGDRKHIARSLAWLWSTDSRRYSARWRSDRLQIVFDWMLDRRWIEARQTGFFVRNYAKYHRTRVTNQAPSEPSEPSEPLKIKSKPASPPPVDKSNKNSQIEEVFRVAKQISGTDSHRCRELCAFVAKTVKQGLKFGDSEEVINDAILYTFNALKARAVKEGRPIDEALLWPYLQQTYKFKRTKALETESDRYKREPMQKAGAILESLMIKR